MNFDRLTVVLLSARSDAPAFTPEEEARIQDAHLAFLADLHEAGHLLAAGPTAGPGERRLRGISILPVPPEEAERLHQSDPAVRAGRLRAEAYPWMVPADVVSSGPGRLPRSMAEVGA